MSSQPVAVYGLEVPAGDIMIQANPANFPATFRITMAAIDPTAEVEDAGDMPIRSTLKLVRLPFGDDEEDSDDDDDDISSIERRLGLESDESEEETNGGPSDPAKSRKARALALLEALKKENDMDVDEEANGVNGDKGKAKASDEEESDDETDYGSEDLDEMEEFVICTLDPKLHCQQPIDIVINKGEPCYFKVTGTHTVYLTGNFTEHPDDTDDEDDEEGDDSMLGYEEDDEELSELDSEDDVLDGLSNRIMEIDSEEEKEAPKLVKSKGKRAAEDSEDEALAPKAAEAAPTEKLSKKQKKKLKNNEGQAVAADKPEEKKTDAKKAKAKDAAKDSPANSKKVQFAEKLEQGPTPTKGDKAADKAKPAEKGNKAKATRVVNGVTIEDRKTGSGQQAKKGDKIGMRYVGKLKDGKVFDSNTRGDPFKFKLGTGEVIKGWDIGVAGMAVGGERRIVVPAQLAYGKKAMPGLPANSELTFDLKLLSIN
ncbi:hypothetical protein EJ06DRAFT_580759 [Trichodelitschia bisporula]|uniref:FK506-binding protein n=1 Tax=Trichodelitschia bisporula TaxID=703511 RepID=A0A6G1I2W4_9PEZI|nr:hypothetical protein EJ06DRAFT_580759 [Trichodelitschia bisporula]